MINKNSIKKGIYPVIPQDISFDEFGYPFYDELNIDNLIEEINVLENNTNYLKNYLNCNKKSFLNISYEDRAKRKRIKEDMKHSKKVIKENKQMIEKASSFDVDLLAKFIADLLSSKKGVDYKIKEVVLTDQFSDSRFYRALYFISTPENIDLLGDLYTDMGISKFYKTLKNFSEDEYVLLELDRKYKYYDSSKNCLKTDDFNEHSYINDALKKAVNIKLSNEMVLDEEIYNSFCDKYSMKKDGKSLVKKAR